MVDAALQANRESRRACVCACAAQCRAWASVPSPMGLPRALILPASFAMTRKACCWRSKASLYAGFRESPAPRIAAAGATRCAGKRAALRRAATRDSSSRSRSHGPARTRIPADAATCEMCLDDLHDPASRFHLYPFVNCTHCGPRYTLTRRLPYDRAQTSMARFRDVRGLRAQITPTRSIAVFTPSPSPARNAGRACRISPPEIVAALRQGEIVALKGIGGFHLLCDARNAGSVAELRRRKNREAKPFAIMLANEASVSLFAAPRAGRIGAAAPIGPADRADGKPRRPARGRCARTWRGSASMLAYAPVHHLLFHAAGGARGQAQDFALVATSANPGGHPLITEQ